MTLIPRLVTSALVTSTLVTSTLVAFTLQTQNAYAITPLKFCFEDTSQAPWTQPDGTGLNIELLRRVEQRLNEKFEITSKPWKRCLEEVRLGVQDGLIGSAASTERRQFSVFPSTPEGKDDRSAALNDDWARVYIRTDSKVHWNGKNLSNVKQPVLVQRAYLIGKILQEKGFQIKEVRTIHDALSALADGSAEVAILQSTEAENLAKYDSSIKHKIAISPQAFIALAMYLPINRQTHARDPRRIQAIWDAIREVRASSEYRQLLTAHGVQFEAR